MIRTDLACEIINKKTVTDGVFVSDKLYEDVPVTLTEISEAASEKIGKPCGKYYTLFRGNPFTEKSETNALAEILRELIPEGRVLVVGLGNEHVTPDSLGPKTVRRIAATSHFRETEEFSELMLREVSVIETGVMAQTGIESADLIRYIVSGTSPKCLIVVDSLSCSDPQRLVSTIQITNSGIAPGSGVGNERRELSERTLGIPVIAIGVPTVIDIKTLAPSYKSDAMVTPREIDGAVTRYSKIISRAVNRVLCPTLTDSEIASITGNQYV